MSKINTKPGKIWLMLSIGMLFGASTAHAATTLSIPQVPLQTGSDVPINLMFVIDDSGSMARGYLPDGISGVCGGSTSVERRARGRSPDYNKAYFDPDEVYIVPPKADGTLYPTPTLGGAWKDGYAGTGFANLKTKFRATWGNNTTSYCGAEGAADYYLYDATECTDPDPEDYQCYKRYIVDEQSVEIQNKFAIWYSYYRTRKMASLAGIGRAFATLPESTRVGYGALNNRPVDRGVREFLGTDRADFFSWLYGQPDTNKGTPLRGALKKVGEYYKTNEPYLTRPLDDDSGLVSCRQNFAILMSDGGWNESTSPAVGDVDGDDYANTLADVAYNYWKDDLRPEAGMPNNVPTSSAGDAEWQHMVTYTVGLGVEGVLKYDDVKDLKPDDSMWTDPGCWSGSACAELPGKVDDFIHAAVNGKGGFFSAKSPGEFATELTDTLNNIQLRTASATNLSATTTSLQEDNSVFQASFNTKSWTGDLVSRDVSDLTKVQWVANFPEEWQDRKIFTSRGKTKIDFSWDDLNTSEQTVLKSQQIVDYLRGNQDLEKTTDEPAGIFRERVSLLGDIANSSPVYVAESQNRNYQRYNWDESPSYQAFVKATKTRAPRVYIGANDGMLHSFNADASAANAGIETFAYVPQAMLASGSSLADFASLDYEHRFFVDGSPTVADVYFDGSWRSVLVSTLGRGGEWMFALDVTDPTAVKVLWDIKLPELGIMPHKPIITRLNNGHWSVVTGYGYNNSTDKSGLLVIDLQSGDVVKKLETPVTVSTGLGQIEGWDQNKNGNIDWIFAGDIDGNIWKFDLSGASDGSWAVAYSGTPLFVARDAALNRQPITGGITLQSHPDTAELWVFFGTGKFIESGDSINDDIQSWYGIKDGATISNRSQLVSRTMSNVTYENPVTSEIRTSRTVPVAAPNDMDGKRGWVMDLPDTRERIISKPRFVGGNLVMNTTIPDTDLCNPQGDGWIMAIDPFKGARLKYHFFDLSRDDNFDANDGVGPADDIASGLRFSGMPGEPVFVGDEMLVGDSRVAIDSSRVNLQIRRGRLSWREMINQ